MPLRIRDRVIGLVEVFDNRASRDLSPEEIQLANAICRFAALALDKARLYDEQRRTADRLDRLAGQLQQLQGFALEINRRLEIADPQEILDEAVRVAVELLGVRAAAAVGGQGDQMVVQALAAATDRPWDDVEGATATPARAGSGARPAGARRRPGATRDGGRHRTSARARAAAAGRARRRGARALPVRCSPRCPTRCSPPTAP